MLHLHKLHFLECMAVKTFCIIYIHIYIFFRKNDIYIILTLIEKDSLAKYTATMVWLVVNFRDFFISLKKNIKHDIIYDFTYPAVTYWDSRVGLAHVTL